MLKGARVLWPEREPYDRLCELRERIGAAAFAAEKQNNPALRRRGVFRPERLRMFRLLDDGQLRCEPMPGEIVEPAERIDNGRPEIRLEQLNIYGFLDPALGEPGGDFAAIVTVGRDIDGYSYVLHAWLERASPLEQVRMAFDLHAHWRYRQFGIESVAFQKLLAGAMASESRRRREQSLAGWNLPTRYVHPTAAKTTRIIELETLVDHGWLLFNRDLPAEFFEQLVTFPAGRHDDGPDALAGAISLADTTSDDKMLITAKPRISREGMRNY